MPINPEGVQSPRTEKSHMVNVGGGGSYIMVVIVGVEKGNSQMRDETGRDER